MAEEDVQPENEPIPVVLAPSAESITFDRDPAVYNPGESGQVTVVDPSRLIEKTITVGALTATFEVTSPYEVPTADQVIFSLSADDPATGTSVWNFSV